MLNKVPKFNLEDVIVQFVDEPNGLQYVEGYLPEEETVMAMVAERSLKLTNTKLLHFFTMSCVSYSCETFT